ncbi:unnamed protein product [Zymoseptoria tritici ST99CH_1A5]|uniref:Uncharacterized protein n=1 Tax=Zymoseptoria tritici ST99CH_1A5 TaxID=1276529 RepID=A0A1Y6LVC2_ZYMTR|nr:unnamed protein product [Zymoseptoria tritici ST99CH_1A5]
MVDFLRWALAAQHPILQPQVDFAAQISPPSPQTEPPFSVGFDFTPSHGIAAASFKNGSNIPLARIEGDHAWRALMTKVSTESDFPHCAPCVSTLANMLRSLTTAAADRLGHPVLSASASMPAHIASLHQLVSPLHNLIEEAFATIGLEYVQIVRFAYSGEPVLFPENSVLAGHGLGLCQPYTSDKSCLGPPEHRTLPSEVYYFVGYYANVLEVSLSSTVLTADGVVPHPYLDYDLGAETLERQSPEVYWDSVRRLLTIPLVAQVWEPTKVIMYGDFGADEKMKEVVKEVLGKHVPEIPEWVEDGVDPKYVAALGAAEFAKRKPYWGYG